MWKLDLFKCDESDGGVQGKSVKIFKTFKLYRPSC